MGMWMSWLDGLVGRRDGWFERHGRSWSGLAMDMGVGDGIWAWVGFHL
jgi:hypothetical protein